MVPNSSPTSLEKLKPKTEEGRPLSQPSMDPPRPPETPPPPSSAQVPKETAARRYKFVWPVLLAVNVGIGAYLFLKANKKDEKEVAEVVGAAPSSTVSATTASATVAVPEKTLPPKPTIVPAVPREPIPEDKQRELFKWMLLEKRKVKTKNPDEKKRVDEEKAILKQFIHAKSLPTILSDIGLKIFSSLNVSICA